MTKQEAIEWFKLMEEKFENTKYAEALDMAIEALEEIYPCGLCKYYEDEENWGVCLYCPAEPKGSDEE